MPMCSFQEKMFLLCPYEEMSSHFKLHMETFSKLCQMVLRVLTLTFLNLKLTFIARFSGWGSTFSRLQSHYDETVTFKHF